MFDEIFRPVNFLYLGIYFAIGYIAYFFTTLSQALDNEEELDEEEDDIPEILLYLFLHPMIFAVFLIGAVIVGLEKSVTYMEKGTVALVNMIIRKKNNRLDK